MSIIIDFAATWFTIGIFALAIDWATGFNRILNNRTGIERHMARQFKEDPESDPRVGFVIGTVVAHIILGPFSFLVDGKNFK